MVNRYSIYISDIEPIGFDVIVMDGFTSSKVITQIEEMLNNQDRLNAMVELNYQIGEKYFSYEVLEEKLTHLMHTF